MDNTTHKDKVWGQSECAEYQSPKCPGPGCPRKRPRSPTPGISTPNTRSMPNLTKAPNLEDTPGVKNMHLTRQTGSNWGIQPALITPPTQVTWETCTACMAQRSPLTLISSQTAITCRIKVIEQIQGQIQIHRTPGNWMIAIGGGAQAIQHSQTMDTNKTQQLSTYTI